MDGWMDGWISIIPVGMIILVLVGNSIYSTRMDGWSGFFLSESFSLLLSPVSTITLPAALSNNSPMSACVPVLVPTLDPALSVFLSLIPSFFLPTLRGIRTDLADRLTPTPTNILTQPSSLHNLRMKWLGRAAGPLRIKPPHPTRLLALDAGPGRRPTDHLDQLGKDGIGILPDGAEELPLPVARLVLFLLAQLALRVLDLGFVVRDGVHVALGDRGRDVAPRAAGFEGVLLVDGGDVEGGGGRGAVGFDLLALFGFAALVHAEGEGVVPLPLDGVEGALVVALAFLPHGGGEGVFLAREPALARVVDLGDVAGGGGDVGVFIELDVGRAGYQGLDV
jgi:hypothetical protein